MSIKQKIISYIVLVVIAIGGLIYLIILPTAKDIKKINDDVLAERIDLEKKYLRGQLLRTTIENFEKIKPQEDKLNEIYIGQNEELKFITALENIANKYNLDQKIQLAENTDTGSVIYESLALNITTSGSYINILQYLKDIERLNFYFNISKISVTTGGKTKTIETPIIISMNGEIFKSKNTKSENASEITE